MKMVFFYIFLFLAFAFFALVIILARNFGKVPTGDYGNLSYYRNGSFIAPEPLPYTFKREIPNEKFSFFRLFFKSKNAPKDKLPTVKPTFAEKPSDFAIFWLGHSNTILELDGKRLIIDPVFENAGPVPFVVSRYVKSPIKRKDLPHIDYVVLTHNHYDHLERETVQKFRKTNTKFIAPLGVADALIGWGIKRNNIIELGWEENFVDDSLSFTLLPSIHFSGRNYNDWNKTLWGSYIIKSKNKSIFWGGDGGYGKHFVEYGKKYGKFDIVALEIDGWNENWSDIHMFPDEVIKTAKDLNSEYVLPIHWAVFDLAMHPWKESINYVVDEVNKNDIKLITPKIGEKVDESNFKDFINNNWWKDYK